MCCTRICFGCKCRFHQPGFVCFGCNCGFESFNQRRISRFFCRESRLDQSGFGCNRRFHELGFGLGCIFCRSSRFHQSGFGCVRRFHEPGIGGIFCI
ncbi:hypothetical protein CAOG_010220 [Capsaspora owczarzaki ATCC 30864]|uniref:Uncharacterized protein n=1 Tax=Capsaspora owczarzaki (strain ATCC 30864) TaxID=595528 RepID=A0A0D2WYZ0_CAPO3|nr:hypothetical protein CAOG_010220 [Capsaspora owczarzaki ATCC 30864]